MTSLTRTEGNRKFHKTLSTVVNFLFVRLRLSEEVGHYLINRCSRRPHIEKLAAAKIQPFWLPASGLSRFHPSMCGRLPEQPSR